MSTSDVIVVEEVEVIFEREIESISEDIPREDWSSLLFDLPVIPKLELAENIKDVGSGKVCTKYISVSDSAVLRHPYYHYPAVIDPGIKEALLLPEPEIVYPDDGQKLYLDLCEEMGICPIRGFHRGLVQNIINLRYYGINPVGVRPMCMALRLNRIVQVLDLTDNFLSRDSCYHLGQLLLQNCVLEEIDLSGCRIGAEGVQQLLPGLSINRTLRKLNLSRNKLEDTGVILLAKAIMQGSSIQDLNLRYNKLGLKAALSLSDAFETTNKLTHLDLSWNELYPLKGIITLLRQLSLNKSLEELNLSWNNLSNIGLSLRSFLTTRNLRVLNLNNNRLQGSAIRELAMGLAKAKKLELLDLSYNPLSPADAFKVLNRMQKRFVKVKKILLDGICVTPEFLELHNKVMGLAIRKDFEITWGTLIGEQVVNRTDLRDLVLNRADYLSRSRKKKDRIDIALFAQALEKVWKNDPIPVKDFMSMCQRAGAKLDEDLVEAIASAFPGPPNKRYKTVNISAMVEFMKRKWPARKLPESVLEVPEPEPVKEPTPPKEVKGKNKKGKK